ncbi:MAG TPA: zf-HC2 domain-containing protein [Kofleriaceae bacterium]|nr:zf-HC2 domain-containing protein [Kofleriaceae bacterium]
MTCPDRDELTQYRERELSERRAPEVRAHVAGCAACTARIARIDQLIGDLGAPLAEADARAVARVMRRLDAPPPARRAWPAVTAALATAAIAVIAVAAWPTRDAGTFAPRGGAPPAHLTAATIARDVGTTWCTLDADHRAVPIPAAVSPTTPYVLAYRNLLQAPPLYALAFAVDARGEVHWLYPAFTRASDDPAAVALPATTTSRLLPDTVVLDGVAPGPLHLIAIVSAERLHVSAIERLRGAELAAAALQRQFARAAITEQLVEVSP